MSLVNDEIAYDITRYSKYNNIQSLALHTITYFVADPKNESVTVNLDHLLKSKLKKTSLMCKYIIIAKKDKLRYS